MRCRHCTWDDGLGGLGLRVKGLGFGVVKGFGVVWDFGGFDLRVKGLGL